MKKNKKYFTIYCRNHIWLRRSILLTQGLVFILAIYTILNYIQSYLVAALVVFFSFFFLKLVPKPSQDSIDVYFDRLIYKSKVKEVELYFNKIAFIDQDVFECENGKSSYKSIEFLDESMNSILYIDGSGYSYEGLVSLCIRIQSINQEHAHLENNNVFGAIYETTRDI